MPESQNVNKSFANSLSFDRPDLLAFFLCVGMFLLWLNLLWVKFVYFGYYDWDLAMYAQATWALSHGSFHSSLFGTNFLTNHAEYIAFFIAPIYRLFPSAFTLIVIKIISFIAGSFVFYLISKKLLGWRLGILLMILYQLHPANAFMMIYEFHFENLAIFFIFLMYYFFLQARLIPFLISAFFATLVKENISLVVLMFGFFAFFTKKENKLPWVIGPMILGGIFFILTMFVITPHLRLQEGIGNANQYLAMYWNHPKSSTSFLQTFTNNFSVLGQTFLSPVNKHYVTELFLPFHILPFLSPLTLFLGVTIFLQHFLAPSFTMHTIYYHYAATAIIFIFLATAETLTKIKKHIQPIFYSLVILITVTGYFLYIKTYLPEFQRRISLWQDRLDPVRQSMFEQIPPDASVVASFDFLDRLANRNELYSLHNVWQNIGTFTGKTPYALPKTLSYGLIDWNCRWLWDDLLYSNNKMMHAYLEHIHDLYFSHPWRVVDAVEEITLLSTLQGNISQLSLSENSQSLFPGSSPTLNIKIGDHIELIDFKLISPIATRRHILPLQFVWLSRQKTNDFLTIEINILKDGENIAHRNHPIGYAFNATPLWGEGQFIKENYNLWIPATMTPGKYTLNISIFNLSKGTYEPLYRDEQKIKNLNVQVYF